MYSENDQYFAEDIIQIDENEIFVDGGAFIGDTVQSFINRAKRKNIKYKIIALEPDEKNNVILKKYFGNKENVVIVKQGLSDKKEVLLFEQKGTGTSRLASDESKSTTSTTNIKFLILQYP